MVKKLVGKKLKVRIMLPVSVHPIKVEIWKNIKLGKIKTGMSLREIGEIIGIGKKPQIIKHHLDVMRNMGVIDYEKGNYKLEIPKL